MQVRHVMLILTALLIAGGVYFYAKTSLPQNSPTVVVASGQSQQVEGTKVLVAIKDVPRGTLIAQAETLFEFKSWPTQSVNSEAYIVEGSAPVQDFNGAVMREGIRAGEPLVRANIVRRGENGFLAAVLPEGARAVSFSVNSNTGIAGFVFPGDHIDLILTHTVQFPAPEDDTDSSRQGNLSHSVSETILHNIRVVAVDSRAGDQAQVPAPYEIVTVQVTPDQAERMAVAQRIGELRIALRSMVKPQAEVASAEGTTGAAAETSAAPTGMESVVEDTTPKTYTIDSDVSQIIVPPVGSDKDEASRTSSKVQVVRGAAVSEVDAK